MGKKEHATSRLPQITKQATLCRPSPRAAPADEVWDECRSQAMRYMFVSRNVYKGALLSPIASFSTEVLKLMPSRCSEAASTCGTGRSCIAIYRHRLLSSVSRRCERQPQRHPACLAPLSSF